MLKNIITCFIFFISHSYADAQAAIVKSNSFYSPSVQLQLKYTAILAASYHKNKTEKYSVVYLLHGHTGNYTSWITYAKLPLELATKYNCIIILPDGGNSWYVNWTGQTDGKPHKWESMLVKDLMPDVSKRYRILADKKHSAIGGLSMGGFGALAVGLKNIDLFGFVFSTAGAINFCRNIKNEMAKDTLDWNSPQLWSGGDKVIDVKGFSTQQERTPQGLVFKTAADADVYNPYLLLAKTDTASLPFIHVDCGNRDDLQKDAFEFMQQVKAKTNRYSFITFPGEHEVPYWEQSVEHTFLIMKNYGVFK